MKEGDAAESSLSLSLLFDVVFMAVCNLYWMRSEKLSQAKKKMIMASINATT
jgi:hypothetical protein